MVSSNHGMVVTVASIAGYIAAPSMVDYAASKAAAIAFHEGLGAELVKVYKAPGVRTVLMCQGHTRTKLFEGFESAGKTLWPETVAEEIVKAVLGGRSKTIVLPGTAWMLAGLRGWPLWMQDGLRKGLDLMKKFHGRQVVQPSEKAGGTEKSVEGSTVLVEEEGESEEESD
jgi:short-subunit dehydrogenase